MKKRNIVIGILFFSAPLIKAGLSGLTIINNTGKEMRVTIKDDKNYRETGLKMLEPHKSGTFTKSKKKQFYGPLLFAFPNDQAMKGSFGAKSKYRYYSTKHYFPAFLKKLEIMWQKDPRGNYWPYIRQTFPYKGFFKKHPWKPCEEKTTSDIYTVNDKVYAKMK